jgi:hypothetical protein
LNKEVELVSLGDGNEQYIFMRKVIKHKVLESRITKKTLVLVLDDHQ